MHRLNGWTLAMLAGLAGCGDEPTGDIFSVDGIVQGSVTAATGGPVADAWVAVEGTYPLGNGNDVSLYDSVRTDGGGHYVGRVGVMNLPDTVASIVFLELRGEGPANPEGFLGHGTLLLESTY